MASGLGLLSLVGRGATTGSLPVGSLSAAVRLVRVGLGALTNTNSKVDTSFSSFNIDVNFNGTTLLQLSTETFTVARESSVTLPYSR